MSAEDDSPRSGRICVVGSANADLVVRTRVLPKPGETVAGGELQLLPGGKSANQAAAAGRLGGRVTLVGAVGDDAYGRMLIDSLEASGVDVAGLAVRDDATTGTAMIAVDERGENFIIVSSAANGLVDEAAVDARADAIADADVLGLSFEIPMGAIIRASEIARANGTTVVLNPSPFALPPVELLANVDILVLNEHELGQLSGLDPDAPLEAHAPALAALGVGRAVVTLGANGAALLVAETTADAAAVTLVDAPRVEAVDTTGCGDAFTGALLLGLSAGDDLLASTRTACAVGAIAATAVGAQSSYPFADELEAFLRERGGAPTA
ncbi:ribokinase [Agrococcus citreus]|uniref:Ribokinase n=1 Tax=Agrococcus citreus TaxID=84643 RepID=A0ABN1YWI2_9MICO